MQAETRILKMDIRGIFETIWSTHSPLQAVHLVGWWMLILEQIKENVPPTNEDIQQWPNLLKKMDKLLMTWLKKSKKWEISSSTTLLEKLSKVPGDILATSFSSEMVELFLQHWKSYVDMEELDETDCLDFQSKMTTSTSSMTVHSPEDTAGTSSGSKLNLLDHLAQLAPKISQSGNSRVPTGTMSSSISFLQNGETVKYGLEEKVGKHRLTINWYDGPKSLTLGDRWYDSKIAGITMSVNDPVLREMVETLITQASMKFMARKPSLQANSATLNRKRRRFY
nr:MAG: ORF4 [Parvoviridae sp.]